jgi:hypothetical protein
MLLSWLSGTGGCLTAQKAGKRASLVLKVIDLKWHLGRKSKGRAGRASFLKMQPY